MMGPVNSERKHLFISERKEKRLEPCILFLQGLLSVQMLKIIRKYLNNRIKKSRILLPKHELYSPLKTDLDGNQVAQGLPWPMSDHRAPLRERSLRPVFTICKFVCFEVGALLLIKGRKEGKAIPSSQFLSAV